MAQAGDTFKPGEKVPNSGVYRVSHDRGHHESHDVTAISGRRFPPCRGCEHGVRFLLVYAAHHISDHEHFKGQEKQHGREIEQASVRSR